jgi:hypothetical protein
LIKEDYNCQWRKFFNINILVNNEWHQLRRVTTIFYALFWLMLLNLLFIWYWESYYSKCKGIIRLKARKKFKMFFVAANRMKIYFKYAGIMGSNNKTSWVMNNVKIF